MNPEGQGAYAPIYRGMSLDVLMGVDPRMLHGSDMSDLYSKLGGEKSFWGGVNAEVTLASGDIDTIDSAVIESIEALGGNGGLILGAFLFQPTSTQQIIAMIDAWKRYRDIHSSVGVV